MTDWTNTPVFLPKPITAIKSLLRRAAEQRRYKQALKSLADADDHVLQDLGLTRDEVTRAVDRRATPTVDAELAYLYGLRSKR